MEPHTFFQKLPDRVSQLCGAAVAATGISALVGWSTGVSVLMSVRTEYIPMAPNTALSFILLGISLILFSVRRPWACRTVRAVSLIVLLIAALRITEYVVGVDLSVDNWFFQFPNKNLGLAPVGRMAFFTALSFLLASIPLVLLSFLPASPLAEGASTAFGGIVVFTALAFFLGYIYGAPLYYGTTTIPMALNTALAFLVIGFGLLTLSIEKMFASRRKVAADLRRAHDELEQRVRERTAELTDEISQRENAERALREAEQRYRTTLDNMVEGCQIIGFDWKYLYLNEAATRQGRRAKEALLGRIMIESYPGIETTEMFSKLRQCMEQRVPIQMDNEFTYPDGSAGWFRLRMEPVPEGTFILSEDITEKKNSEETIRQQAALLDVDPDAILVINLDGTVRFWNKGAEQMFGWMAEEIIGKRVSDVLFMDPKLVKLFSNGTENAPAKKGTLTGEGKLIGKDGKEVFARASVVSVHNDDGTKRFTYAVLSDITENKKLEAQFYRSQRLESIGTLAGGIAHDLNNLLAPILLGVEIFRKKGLSQKEQKIIESMATNARRGADIVKQVLTFARGVEGERKALRLSHILAEIENIVRETFPRSIELRLRVPQDLWLTSGDHTQLYQVFMNLCVNARDAMPQGGKLTVEAENVIIDDHYAGLNIEATVGPHVVVTVSDTGSGIPPQLIDKVFDPFFTTKQIGKGTGLGLSTVRGIIKSHGGFVSVYSELGAGTRFKVYVPAVEGEENQESQTVPSSLPKGKGELILVTDDEEAIRNIVKNTLEKFGYKVVTAKDGAEAVAIFVKLRGKISAILTDMMMPVMDGPTMIRTIRKIDADVKIILSSGLGSGDPSQWGTIVQAILQKPYTSEKLLTTLSTVLNRQ